MCSPNAVAFYLRLHSKSWCCDTDPKGSLCQLPNFSTMLTTTVSTDQMCMRMRTPHTVFLLATVRGPSFLSTHDRRRAPQSDSAVWAVRLVVLSEQALAACRVDERPHVS